MVEAAHQSTAVSSGEILSAVLAPSQESPDTVEFTRKPITIPSDVIRTGITRKNLETISEWEKSVWGEGGRSFVSSVDQLDQELSESREVWTQVLEEKAHLSDSGTIHKLREEIADGIISNIGILRHIDPDNDSAANFIYRSVYESNKSRKRSTESSIILYQLKGQKLLDRIKDCGQDCIDNMTNPDKNEIKMMVGSVMKAGFESLEKLEIQPDEIVADKVRIISQLKYSPQRVREKGSVQEAKKDWEVKQLPVVGEVVLLEAA